jgi:ATP-dependent RNA helicase RhlE
MPTSFAELGVSKPVADALRSRGITEPFPVQQLVIEDVLAGDDVLVQSPTGSGKTLAFGVPMVERLDSNGPRPAALILAPTRELACQIVDELESLCYARALKIATVYGGVGINPQIKAVRKAHVVVATPGRLEDLIQRRAIDLSKIRMLVLDEADRMLDMGFRPPVDRIVSLLPRKRQTLFFSATLEGQAGEIAQQYTYKPHTHTHAPEPEGPRAITHSFQLVDSQAAKVDTLVDQLKTGDCGRTLVFVRTKRGADRLVKKLGQQNVKALAMHGDKSQGQRQKALARFERGDLMTLVATDVAARGIDVNDITDVINYDIPEDRETYTHRTGRTGRAGAVGRAMTYVLSDQRADVRPIARDLDLTAELERAIGSGGHGGHAKGGRPNGNGKKPRTPGKGQGRTTGNRSNNGNANGNGGHGGRKHKSRKGSSNNGNSFNHRYGSGNGNGNGGGGKRKSSKRPARAGGGGGR